MLFIIDVLAVVLTPIAPRVDTSAMHVIVLPGALVDTAIGPLVSAAATDFVVGPLA